MEAEFAKREELRKKEFETALLQVVEDFKAESAQAVRAVKDHVEAIRIKKQAEKQAMALHRKTARLQTTSGIFQNSQGAGASAQGAASAVPEELREGDRVTVQSLNREGIVESIGDGTCHVMVGPLRYRADRNDLIKIRGAAPAAPAVFSRNIRLDAPADSDAELKVIGLNVDDALSRVDKFLDQAFLNGMDSVRIIHGHGKGILRSAIAEFLSNHPQVESYTLAPREKGGGGATLAKIRQ
jgi:DNA mismatch repair protein MutS2